MSTLPPESAELDTVEDAAEADSETQPAGTTKKEKERHRKAQQSVRKAEEVKETLEKAMASMAERVARCVQLPATCLCMRCHRSSVTTTAEQRTDVMCEL